MTTARSYFFNTLLSLFALLLLHLGCFFFLHRSSAEEQPPQLNRRKRVSPSSPSLLPPPSNSTSKSLNSFSFRTCISRVLSFRKPICSSEEQGQQHRHVVGHPPVFSSHLIPPSPDGIAKVIQPDVERKVEVYAKQYSFSSRFEIYPCPACGEVLSKPQLLDLHHAAKHSLSELCHADSGYNIVRIIFESGWKGKPPAVHRILKIHNTGRALSRFEEYRDAVRSRAAAARKGGGDERCIADGNERLRFYCTTSLCCGGGGAPAPGACGRQYCSACAVVRHGFTGKDADADGIATHATSWGAHAALPEDLEREFAFLGARRAILVCRVVAGRVAQGHGAAGVAEEKDVGFDSVAPMSRQCGGHFDEDELLVFSPRAVLPCFIIIYTAS
ncbi:hypothetical protein Cni_G15704 [Canna indica]|uniref:C2H2-type domain-containing protein n=1 Tax=Canna indica TaxID=4628 RepID=A0AAQ3KDU9_9LILI|nr:hypothetical protein Cni_G15704 [Canna indica]